MISNPISVRVGRRFAAPPKRVFDAWLDAGTAGDWLFATPDGEMIQVEIDPRPGGHFHIVERRGGQDVAHHGVYVTMDPPCTLAFDLTVSAAGEAATRVTVEVAPDGEGAALTLTHQIDPAWADFAERTAQGWARVLEALARSLGEAPSP
jgi:uncharacterized protein YndB with AHSA1/START domain